MEAKQSPTALDEYFHALWSQLQPDEQETLARKLVELHNRHVQELNALVVDFFGSQPGWVEIK